MRPVNKGNRQQVNKDEQKERSAKIRFYFGKRTTSN